MGTVLGFHGIDTNDPNWTRSLFAEFAHLSPALQLSYLPFKPEHVKVEFELQSARSWKWENQKELISDHEISRIALAILTISACCCVAFSAASACRTRRNTKLWRTRPLTSCYSSCRIHLSRGTANKRYNRAQRTCSPHCWDFSTDWNRSSQRSKSKQSAVEIEAVGGRNRSSQWS